MKRDEGGMLLTIVTLPDMSGDRGFPFDIPALQGLDGLTLDSHVTFFVGENGSGKSTFLEALAAATGLPTVGSQSAARDPTLGPQRELGRQMRLSWERNTHRGFFLRAEDFFGFTKRVSEMRRDFERELVEIDEKFKDHSPLARMLARGPASGSIADMERRYGVELDANSHGESFLKLFQTRFVPKGLYLLDEPEAALSPQSQLAFMAMIKDMVEQGSQFLIATHSPILMATPGSTIFSFDERPVRAVAYDELEAVTLTRDFLNNPERFLRHLWS